MRIGDRTRTFLLLLVLSGGLLACGFLIAGTAGLLVASGMSLLAVIGAWRFGDRLVLRLYDARPLSFVEAPSLHRVLHRLSHIAGVPAPQLYVIPESAPNALSTGRSVCHASIALTEGLLQQLSASEIEAVIAQQLALIRRGDTHLMSVAAAITGSIASVTNFLLWGTLAPPMAGESAPLSPLANVARLIFTPPAALIIRLVVSPQRQLEADRLAVHWTGSPSTLAAAIRKMTDRARSARMYSGGAETAHVFVVDPFPTEHHFPTHPGGEKRIRLLESLPTWNQHAA